MPLPKTTNKKPNRLINQKSPYLLQHAYNPVTWYPWSAEAFDKAMEEDKPIFLSIGYSTCHWCHVMERESFEDQEVADILNQHYVAIKVDREERPDIDHIYMSICQALTGSGGWPLTIIMTPDKKPFFAGTYFPKHNKMGLMGLVGILTNIAESWSSNKHLFSQSGDDIIQAMKTLSESNTDVIVNQDDIKRCFTNLIYSFDKDYGGFGYAPKFPTPHNLMFLLRYWKNFNDKSALDIVEKTLDSMYRGGIFDHIGFGFSRYSTDNKWLVPHFEKMLYDNALISIVYLEAFQATGKKLYKDVAQKVFDYMLRDMTSPQSGFYSAEDADSEGEEGKFYLWTIDEIESVIGAADTQLFCSFYNITPEGNFESRNIPNLIDTRTDNFSDQLKARIEKCREMLLNYREKRVHPHKDDKILTSWNGLMIAALSFGSRVLENERYLHAAENAVKFIINNLKDSKGRLLARYRDGEPAYPAYIDDYAFLIWGLIELYEASHKPEYLKSAVELNQQLIDYFWDEEKGGLFLYGKDSEQLLLRPKDSYDGSTPSGNSVSTMNFLRLARLTGKYELEDYANKQFKVFGNSVNNYPTSHSYFLIAFLFASSKPKEIVIVGKTDKDDMNRMIKTINTSFLPNMIFHIKGEDETIQDSNYLPPYLLEHKAVNNSATAYICENFSCHEPITDLQHFEEIVSQ